MLARLAMMLPSFTPAIVKRLGTAIPAILYKYARLLLLRFFGETRVSLGRDYEQVNAESVRSFRGILRAMLVTRKAERRSYQCAVFRSYSRPPKIALRVPEILPFDPLNRNSALSDHKNDPNGAEGCSRQQSSCELERKLPIACRCRIVPHLHGDLAYK